jgi:hypothetical protein
MTVQHYNVKVFVNQFPIVKRFVYHLLYYRALHKHFKEGHPESDFWVHTINAHLFQAAILWCMVFGSDGTNPTHWKQLSPTKADELQKSFRDGLLEHTGLTQQEWEKCWKDVKHFRDKYVAHRELVPYSHPVPYFENALKVAYFYDAWIRRIILPDSFAEPSLKLFANKLSKSADDLARKLFDATEPHPH